MPLRFRFTDSSQVGKAAPSKFPRAASQILCAWVLFVASPLAARAEPKLPNIIGDHMVLQQGREIHLWGWADPREAIKVAMLSIDRRTSADAAGHWSVMLPALKSGGPFTISIEGNKTILLNDVLVGEVWVASGQSNMAFPLSHAQNSAEELRRAPNPEIRLFKVARATAPEPQATVQGSWQACSPETAKDFAAVAYFFGQRLYAALNVPLGIIDSSWGGTDAELWTDAASLRSLPELQPALQKWNAQSQPAGRTSIPFELDIDDVELLTVSPAGNSTLLSSFDDVRSRNSMGGYWTVPFQPETRLELVEPGYGGGGYALRCAGQFPASAAGAVEVTTTFASGSAPSDLSQYAGLSFYAKGDASFGVVLQQPSVVDGDSFHSARFQASGQWRPITIWFKDLRQTGWGVVEPFTPQALTGLAIRVAPSAEKMRAAFPFSPSSLYNGMIAPLTPYPIRGVIWYQGENNVERSRQYEKLLTAMIQGWRREWNEPDFPFLIVQLPNLGTATLEANSMSDESLAELREAQYLTMKHLSNTGLVVTTDLGEPWNIHPPRKAEVGQRLALWALGTTYNKPIEYSGPLYQSSKIESDHIRLYFSHVGRGLDVRGGDILKGFSIAGSDKTFHPANAAVDVDTVVVSSPEVKSPEEVRYDWSGNPDGNLWNKDGFPASPFRTDE